MNDAGVFRLHPIQEIPAEELESVIRVNLLSYLHTSRSAAVADIIRRGKDGCIVNISSIVSMIGLPGGTAYAASKGGTTGLTVCLAREVARYGIRVNAVALGYIEREMIRWITEEYRSKVISRNPMRRIEAWEEGAKAVAFLEEDTNSFLWRTPPV
jgi:3-oxoacyl-[acyl-carrier protein] reductase